MVKTLIAAFAIAAVSPAQTTPELRSAAHFGAHPDDGATDATPGIQAAINAAKQGRVYLPGDVPGTGAVARPLIRNGSLTGFEITNPGSRYCKAPEIVLTGGNGRGAKATARVDRDCHLNAVTVIEAGSGYTEPPTVHIVPQLRCYKVSQIRIFTGTMLEGDGEATCLIPDGSNKPVIYSEGAYKFRLRNFALHGDGATDIGMQFNGAEGGTYQSDGTAGSDSSLCTLDAVTVTGFRSKNIELNQTWGYLFLNVHSVKSGGWGLYLRDGFNNATQIIGGEYSQNGIGGLHIGIDSIQLYFSSIAEGNAKYAIYYHGHLTGLQINDAYFEANGHNHTGCDVYGDFLDYDQPAIGVSIRNSLFNSLDAACAVHVENTVDFEFAHNIGMPPLPGDSFTENAVILGKGVINPAFEGNTRLDVRGGSDIPIHTGAANFLENALLHSNAMNHRVWSYQNTGEGCPARAHVCQDGTRFHENGAAWKIPLASGSGAANMTTVTQSIPAASAGHLVGGGAWIRTGSGTGTAWVEVFDKSAVYTGSVLNQPLRQTIDTNWRWISTDVATDAGNQGGSSSLRFRMYANDGSDARAVYVYGAQGWLDTAVVPQYAATGGAPVTRRVQTGPPALPAIVTPPDCRGLPNGILGYDAAADKIWACNNGVAKAH